MCGVCVLILNMHLANGKWIPLNALECKRFGGLAFCFNFKRYSSESLTLFELAFRCSRQPHTHTYMRCLPAVVLSIATAKCILLCAHLQVYYLLHSIENARCSLFCYIKKNPNNILQMKFIKCTPHRMHRVQRNKRNKERKKTKTKFRQFQHSKIQMQSANCISEKRAYSLALRPNSGQ